MCNLGAAPDGRRSTRGACPRRPVECVDAEVHIPGGPHIDGWEPGASFTMLAGVLLTGQRGTQSGNLWVWPGHTSITRACSGSAARPFSSAAG